MATRVHLTILKTIPKNHLLVALLQIQDYHFAIFPSFLPTYLPTYLPSEEEEEKPGGTRLIYCSKGGVQLASQQRGEGVSMPVIDLDPR
jgi:hypothetical protein